MPTTPNMFHYSGRLPGIPELSSNTWPPHPEMPVTFDSEGAPLNRISDDRWDFTAHAGKTFTMGFNERPPAKLILSSENSKILKLLICWYIYGPCARNTVNTLSVYQQCLVRVLTVCSDAGIAADQAYRFPAICRAIIETEKFSQQSTIILGILHDIWTFREELGFYIFDEYYLTDLAKQCRRGDAEQTAYIPPRIWNYQLRRLTECIDDFLAHKDQISKYYNYALDRYYEYYGSIQEAYAREMGPTPIGPFNKAVKSLPIAKTFNFETIEDAERRFGVHGLISKWIGSKGIRRLSKYMSLVRDVATAAIANSSLMRISEVYSLRSDCHIIEADDNANELIHLLVGETTKTDPDSDARWIVTERAGRAVTAAACIAALRKRSYIDNPYFAVTDDECSNPHLICRAKDPWSSTRRANSTALMQVKSYSGYTKLYPKLFDLDELRIDEKDYKDSCRLNEGLPETGFGVDCIWPLRFHQLRRTGAVNMLASGVVSETSLQYQLKHLSRQMTRYYGRHYLRLHVRLNEAEKAFFVTELYDSIGRMFAGLNDGTHFSPHGKRHTEQILQPITGKAHSELLAAAKKGEISYRVTFLGGCFNPNPCPFGGISNITECIGFGDKKPCQFVLVSKQKKDVIEQAAVAWKDMAQSIEDPSRERAAITTQVESAQRALDAIDG